MRRTFIALIVFSLFLVVITMLSIPDPTPHLNTLSAEDARKVLLDRANDLAEVKAFRDKYGEVDTAVFAYHVIYYKQVPVTDAPYNATRKVQNIAALNIDFDYEANVKNMDFVCATENGALKLTENITATLEKGDCLDKIA